MLLVVIYFFFNDTATTEIYTLSLHDALPIFLVARRDALDGALERLDRGGRPDLPDHVGQRARDLLRVEQHADDRDERDERREERQDPVVGQGGRPVGEVVLLELAKGALGRGHRSALAFVSTFLGARHVSRFAPTRAPETARPGPYGAPPLPAAARAT